MNQTVTLDDVARLAGVSPKTVSRVVNGEAHVREKTRLAVQSAIAELGYQPNMAARSLAASRSFLIGLISLRMDAYIFRSMHSSGVRACRRRGLHLLVEELEGLDRESLKLLQKTIRQMHIEGAIITQVSDRPAILDLLESMKIPYVRVLPMQNIGRADVVRSDMEQGMRLMADHLWELGHRRYAIATVENHQKPSIRDALLEKGCNPEDIRELELDWNKPPVEAGAELAAQILSLSQRPTAVHAFNDEVAAGFINYAWAHGVHIPRDMSVVGVDDGEIARVVWPQLTTLHQPFGEMIEIAVDLLAEPAADGEPREIVCPVELVVRASTTTAPT